MELLIKTAATRQNQRRRKWIIIAGSVLNLAAFPAAVVLEIMFQRQAWWENNRFFILPVIPFVIGTLIAFSGMTMTDHRRDLAEWGCRMPLTCVAYGSIIYVVFFLIKPDLFLMMVAFIAGSALCNLAGAFITAAAARLFLPRDG